MTDGDEARAARIDHVLIAVADFDNAAARLWDEHGLAAVEGGRHTGWGTGNWIVPLGDGYLELVGVLDEAEARESEFGRRVLQAVALGGGPFAWCVEPVDFDGIVGRLELEIAPGSRVRPDGTRLAWRTAGRDVGLADPSRPFFIAWELPSPADHPGRDPAAHRAAPSGIAWVEVSGDPALIGRWLGHADLRVRIRLGDPAFLSVGIATDTGDLVLP